MKTWSELTEIQPLASRIMTNSIQKDRISHAYLLQGERGTGKEAVALLLAKTLFCSNRSGVEPCQECNACKRIDSGNYPDLHWIEPDGQSIKKEQIEHLQKEFTYSGMETDQKVYVVKGADTLTPNASNRILKFLEEPSKQTTAILMTENSSSIIPTIRSRCQIIDLKPLHPQAFQEQLIHQGISRRSAVLLSTLTNNLDEAVSWSEDEWFAQARKLMIQLVETFSTNAHDAYLFIHQQWLPHFKERPQQEQGLDLLLLAFKDILYYHIGRKDAMTVFAKDDAAIENLVLFFSQEKLLDILNKLLDAKRKLKQNVHPTLVMEQLTIQIQG
ncbi:DNA polymerase III subunit delta' [Lentibacillus salicampi]|uniref:DNA polymerase III subunit delta' n=1 Tax=Lentibacillus salicampi TaxID=175306 RepID=A0A4Y9AAT1_9BACI|nr:DNA polymerase III subunit delta' [Lentibacillus salicampi]TFJ93019.1 DNA polymerase III subunit delta' [Lentibacillus salicampi]